MERLVVLFDRCVATVDPSEGLLRLVECVPLARLDPSRCGQLRHIPAMTLEAIRRYHAQVAPEHMSEFEIGDRVFSAKAAKSEEFRCKIEAAMLLEWTGTEC